MSESQWLADYEWALNEFDGDGDEESLRRRLHSLGFDPHEIDEEIARQQA